ECVADIAPASRGREHGLLRRRATLPTEARGDRQTQAVPQRASHLFRLIETARRVPPPVQWNGDQNGRTLLPDPSTGRQACRHRRLPGPPHELAQEARRREFTTELGRGD